MDDLKFQIKILYIILITGTIIISARTGGATGDQVFLKPGEKNIVMILQAREAHALITENRNNADFIILDIRTSWEFQSGHIPGAVNVNFYSHAFETDIEKLDKKKTYLVYCRTGRRTGMAIKKMVSKGFEKIYTFHGDISAWQALGLPVVKGIQDRVN